MCELAKNVLKVRVRTSPLRGQRAGSRKRSEGRHSAQCLAQSVSWSPSIARAAAAVASQALLQCCRSLTSLGSLLSAVSQAAGETRWVEAKERASCVSASCVAWEPMSPIPTLKKCKNSRYQWVRLYVQNYGGYLGLLVNQLAWQMSSGICERIYLKTKVGKNRERPNISLLPSHNMHIHMWKSEEDQGANNPRFQGFPVWEVEHKQPQELCFSWRCYI